MLSIAFYVILIFMQLFEYDNSRFPQASAALADHLQQTDRTAVQGAVAIFGGSARSALMEVVSGIIRPIRDVDITAIGDDLSDENFKNLSRQINPGDADYAAARVQRYPGIPALLNSNIDFTINRAVLRVGPQLQLVTTQQAISACESRVIKPTIERIAQTQKLQVLHQTEPSDIAALKRFRRNQTGMPARAAYFAAVLEAAGIHYAIDMLDHPVPSDPSDSHTFFLGLMVNKALMVDEAERGPGDTTATLHLFRMYESTGLTKDTKPASPEDIVAYCEAVNEEHPQLKFYGSSVVQSVRHTDKQPAPRIK